MTRSMKWLGIVVTGIALTGVGAWAFHSTPEVQVERALVTAGAIPVGVATGRVQ